MAKIVILHAVSDDTLASRHPIFAKNKKTREHRLATSICPLQHRCQRQRARWLLHRRSMPAETATVRYADTETFATLFHDGCALRSSHEYDFFDGNIANNWHPLSQRQPSLPDG